MSRYYGMRAVERLYLKLEPELNNIARNIVAKLSGSVTYNEVRAELAVKFNEMFVQYYETHKQYCGLVYTATLNAMRNVLRRANTQEKYFSSNDRMLAANVGACQDEGGQVDYMRIWGNVSDPNNQFDKAAITEVITKARAMLAQHAATDEEAHEAALAMECVMTGLASTSDVRTALKLRRADRIRSLKGHERTALNRIEAKVVKEDDEIEGALKMTMIKILDLIENVVMPALLDGADNDQFTLQHS